MKKLVSLLCAALIAAAAIFLPGGAAAADEAADADAMLHTEGNQLVNENGVAVRLIGLNVPYMSWSDNCETQVMNAVEVALDQWNSNAVRLAVTPELWFGANKTAYRALADKVVETVSAAGKYIIFDNHSFYLPDDNDIAFWADAAEHYKDHPYVIYEMFNEPAGCTWQQYYEGGALSYTGKNDWGEDANITIQSCGMPELLKTVRATGAKNVCILPGINWSFDLSFCTEANFRDYAKQIAETAGAADQDAFIDDYVEKYFMKETTGNGIMYSTHPYPSKPVDWDQYLKDTVLEYPVLVGECGPTEKENGFIRSLSDNDKSYLDTLTAYIDQYELNVTPWAWGAWPYLNQEPSDKLSAFGTYMLKYFEQSNAEKAVTLYPETDYNGTGCTVEAGKYSAAALTAMGFDLAALQSASCKDDYYQYTVKLYAKEDFSGDSYTFVPSAANVGKEICGFTAKSVAIVRTVPENILQGHASVLAPGSEENQPIENIIDGKTSTFWKNTDKEPNEVVISLDKVYALNGITIAHASEASMMSVFNASDYTVSVSTDGKTFTRIIDVTDNSLGLCKYSFEQVLACYIKIKLTKGSIIDNDTYYLAEVMAFGTEYTGSTDQISVSIGTYTDDKTVEKAKTPILPIVFICVFGAIVLASAVVIVLFAVKRGKRAAGVPKAR